MCVLSMYFVYIHSLATCSSPLSHEPPHRNSSPVLFWVSGRLREDPQIFEARPVPQVFFANANCKQRWPLEMVGLGMGLTLGDVVGH